VAEHLGRHIAVAVRALADRKEAALALVALAADDRERDDDPLAFLQRSVQAPAGLDHLPHELVAHDVALLHRRDEVVVEVEIRAADRAGRHANDGVAVVLDLRVGNGVAADVLGAVPDEGPHRFSPKDSSSSGRRMLERAAWISTGWRVLFQRRSTMFRSAFK
jgi:hypothetical protein